MAEKLVFESAIEGLFIRGLGPRVTPALKAELKTLGLDLDRKLPPACTRAVWYATIVAVVRHLYPGSSPADAHRELGRMMMEGIELTLFGRTMAPAVKLLGPLTRAVTGDATTPWVLLRSEDREGIDSDRGQEWPVGNRGKEYRLGNFDCRVSYRWARETDLRESFSVTIVRNEPACFVLSLTLRTPHITIPSGPERFCVQRHDGGSAEEFDALVRFLHAESKG